MDERSHQVERYVGCDPMQHIPKHRNGGKFPLRSQLLNSIDFWSPEEKRGVGERKRER